MISDVIASRPVTAELTKAANNNFSSQDKGLVSDSKSFSAFANETRLSNKAPTENQDQASVVDNHGEQYGIAADMVSEFTGERATHTGFSTPLLAISTMGVGNGALQKSTPQDAAVPSLTVQHTLASSPGAEDLPSAASVVAGFNYPGVTGQASSLGSGDRFAQMMPNVITKALGPDGSRSGISFTYADPDPTTAAKAWGDGMSGVTSKTFPTGALAADASLTQALSASSLSTQALPKSAVPMRESSLINPMTMGLAQQLMAESKVGEVTDTHSQTFSHLLARGPLNPVSQWGPVPVNMAGSLTQQAQDMLTPLREQLRFQIDQQIKHAEIRLDPPELGKLELNIRLDGDRLQVQMHAANPAIRDALLSGLERLRADLAQEYGGTLDVDVSQGESRQQEPEQGDTRIAVNHLQAQDVTRESAAAQEHQLNLLA